MWSLLPAVYAAAPTMLVSSDAIGPLNPTFMLRFKVRSIVSLNVRAVTGWLDGGEKRYPGRIVNV
jgi:hypothetical protein